MRFCFAVFIAVLAAFAPLHASAQKRDDAPASAPAPNQPPRQMSPRQMSSQGEAAAREFLTLMFVDSGLVSQSVDAAFAEHGPSLRALASEMDQEVRLSAPQRTALETYISSLDVVVEEEFNRFIPSLINSMTGEMASRFSDDELIGIAAAFRDPVLRNFFVRAIIASAQAAASNTAAPEPTFTMQEIRALARFGETPAGQAFSERAGELTGPLTLHLQQEMSAALPRLQARVAADLCEILGNDCPAEMRRFRT